MENQRNKPEKRDIDEQYLMSIMAGSSKKIIPSVEAEPLPKTNVEQDVNSEPIQEKTVSKERNKNKKDSNGTYGERFLSTHTMTKRGDKSIYIRPEYHERLSRIVHTIGEDQIPLYAYLDNILEHHFGMFEKAITENFNDKYKPIF